MDAECSKQAGQFGEAENRKSRAGMCQDTFFLKKKEILENDQC